MERACRLLPSDDALVLALASACLGQDDARAVELFARLAARYASRETWTGLAISRRNLGDLAGAADAVSRALATLVPDDTLAGIADLIARQLAAPGWCGRSTGSDGGPWEPNHGRPDGWLCRSRGGAPHTLSV